MKRSMFLREPATRWVEFKPVLGQLVLTPNKLVFLSSDTESKDDWSIDLADLEKVDYYKRFRFHQRGLVVFRKDGEIDQFSVPDHKAWKEKISLCIRKTF